MRTLLVLVAGVSAVGLGVFTYYETRRTPEPPPVRGDDGVPQGEHAEIAGELSLDEAKSRIDSEQRTLVEQAPSEVERLFLARMFALRDRLTGSPSETAFALRAVSRYAQGRSHAEDSQSMASKGLGFLTRAEAQVGIAVSQRQAVLRNAALLADSSDDDLRLLVASLLEECKQRGGLGYAPAEVALAKLLKDEYVLNGLPAQRGVRDKARLIAKRNEH